MDRIRSDVSDVLGIPATALTDDTPLPDQGLDSIRLMSLVERWRAFGSTVTFADLAERPTLNDWAEFFTSRTDGHA
ncbi:phosphopantetheine-binding protein [Nocardia brevicatena]|uniref:phosphopantetheine-binding protein n=1 Tax=Nocardia brevicatena TaxID=37327 RepID=UPI0002FE0D0B|nr:phosphopantetheine-binding protein [Nocardia brevicatena]